MATSGSLSVLGLDTFSNSNVKQPVSMHELVFSLNLRQTILSHSFPPVANNKETDFFPLFIGLQSYSIFK